MPLVAVCLGYFMVILDVTIVNVALPALRGDLGATISDLQWVIDGYALMFAALLLSGGALSDRLGARRVFVAGLGLFVATSAVCGIATTSGFLILARFAQGIGAALMVPASLALLQAAYDDPGARARAVGAWGAIAGVAAASGPVLGGLLVDAVSWRAVFFVNVPIGLLALALTLRYVPAPEARPGRGLDLRAQIVAVLGLGALTLALIDAGHTSWTAGPVLAGFAVSLVMIGAFVVLERGAREPMLPLDLFANRTFSAASVVGVLINLGFYGELFVLNLAFQQARGYSPLVAGVALLPQMGMATIGSALSGRFTSRIGSPRPTMLIGLLIGGLGLVALALAGSDAAYLLLVAPLVAAGFGMSFTMPAATTAVVETAPGSLAGIASGVINAGRQVGGVIGVALLGSLATAGGAGGLQAALVVAGAAFLIAAAVTFTNVEPPGSPQATRTSTA